VNSDKIGLTSEQVRELLEMSDKFGKLVGNNISDPNVWFGHQLNNYLTTLALEAEFENIGRSTKKAPLCVEKQ
jgi:hypothetical protein